MTVFLSAYTNGVDKKGRVSVPAPFRAELATHSRQTVVVYAAPNEPFLYGWGYDDFVKFTEKIMQLPPMSKTRQRLARTILAAAQPLSFDENGRILLPERFLKSADIQTKATFAGQGDFFTMWNPDAYEATLNADQEHFDDDWEALTENGWGL